MTRVTIKNNLTSDLDAAIERQVDLSIRAVEDTLRSLLLALDNSSQNSLRVRCGIDAVLTNGAKITFDVEHVHAETAVRDALERVKREARRSRALRSTG